MNYTYYIVYNHSAKGYGSCVITLYEEKEIDSQYILDEIVMEICKREDVYKDHITIVNWKLLNSVG